MHFIREICGYPIFDLKTSISQLVRVNNESEEFISSRKLFCTNNQINIINININIKFLIA
jgi:hypothetical protein